MVMLTDQADDFITAIKTLLDAELAWFDVGTGVATAEDPTNAALDARIAGSEQAIIWAWDAERQELSVEVHYGWDAADPDGGHLNTNGNTLTEMAMYDADPSGAGVLRWRHTHTAFIKTVSSRFKAEIVIRIDLVES